MYKRLTYLLTVFSTDRPVRDQLTDVYVVWTTHLPILGYSRPHHSSPGGRHLVGCPDGK